MIKNKKQYTMMKKQLEELLTNIWDIKEILQKENNIPLRLQLGTFERGLVKLQKELEEQQIQRYEQSDYLSASFERILQLLEALEIRMILRKDFKKDAFKATPANVWELNDKIRKRGSILQIAGEE